MGTQGLMRIVLDTNVFLAALISPNGAPDAIFRAWRSGRFEVVTCGVQLDELRRVSRYPKLKAILPAHRIGTLINNLQRAVVLEKLPVLADDVALDDADDAFLLRMTLALEVDWLLTGDRRAGLLKLGRFGRTRIATPAVFASWLSRP